MGSNKPADPHYQTLSSHLILVDLCTTLVHDGKTLSNKFIVRGSAYLSLEIRSSLRPMLNWVLIVLTGLIARPT